MSDVDLDRVWLGVATVVWQRRPGRVERLAGRVLRSPGLARALLTTPSLLVPWLIATIVTFAAGAAVTLGTRAPVVALLAPAVAAVGIAYAYGPGVDPAWELSQSMAVSDRMVLLVRALAVFAVDALLGMAASLVSGFAVGITLGWLMPMTAISALALATATLSRSANAGVAAGLVAWAITVLSSRAIGGQISISYADPALLAPYLAAAVGLAVIVAFVTRLPKGTS